MVSALGGQWTNSRVVFHVPEGPLVADPVTGNQRPGSVDLTYEVYLRSKPPNPREYPGITIDQTTAEGYMTKPQVLDPRIQNGCKCTVYFSTDPPYDGELVAARIKFGTTGPASIVQVMIGDDVIIRRFIPV